MVSEIIYSSQETEVTAHKRMVRSSDQVALFGLALAVAILHGVLNGQYGFHRDELDILLNARQLAWGYVAYPPFTPFIARLGLELFGDSLQGLRLFSAAAQGIVVVLVGLMARDLGGRRPAQLLAASAAAIAPVALTAGTLLQYMAFDYVWWVLLAFFFLPNLIWQIQHQFISLEFLSAIHARDISWGRTGSFLPDQFYVATNPLMVPLWLAGLAYCLFHPHGRRFRAVGWMFLVTFVLLLVSQGRGYYVGPAYAMLFAAGAVWWEGWLAGRKDNSRRLAQVLPWSLLAVGSLLGVALAKPIAPINSSLWEITSKVNGEMVEMVGWPELVAQVAEIYAKIPDAEKQATVILAGNYGEAGALDLYGPEMGLPRMISGSNSLWARGYGSPEPETLIVVGFERAYALRFFATCETGGRVTNRYGVKNEEAQYHNGLYVCRQPRRPWAELWQQMQWFQ